jgi:hypothetical protein
MANRISKALELGLTTNCIEIDYIECKLRNNMKINITNIQKFTSSYSFEKCPVMVVRKMRSQFIN